MVRVRFINKHTALLQEHAFYQSVNQTQTSKSQKSEKHQNSQQKNGVKIKSEQAEEELMLAKTLNQMRTEGELAELLDEGILKAATDKQYIQEVIANTENTDDLDEDTWLMEIKMIIEESFKEDPYSNRIQVLANIAQIPKMVPILNKKMDLIQKFLDEVESKANKKFKKGMHHRPFATKQVENFESFVKSEQHNPHYSKTLQNSLKKGTKMVPVAPSDKFTVLPGPQMDATNIKTFSNAIFGRAFHEIKIKDDIRKFMFLISDFEIKILKTNIKRKDQMLVVDITCKFDPKEWEYSMIVTLLMHDSEVGYFMPIGHIILQNYDTDWFIVCFEWFKNKFGHNFDPKLVGIDTSLELAKATQVVFPRAKKFVTMIDFTKHLWKMILESELTK